MSHANSGGSPAARPLPGGTPALPAVLIFDFDGVLADSLDLFEACLRGACADVDAPPPADRAAFLRLFDTNMFAGLLAAGVPAATQPALVAALRGRLESRAAEYRLWPGVPDVLAQLAETHALAVVTSGIAGVVAGVLQRHGVTAIREIRGAEQGAGKVAKIRGVAAAHPDRTAWYIGDTLGDMLEGREAGARTVAAGWGWHDAAWLRRGQPDCEAAAPADLARFFAYPARRAATGSEHRT
jgi:phosphoglycolate phosphatase